MLARRPRSRQACVCLSCVMCGLGSLVGVVVIHRFHQHYVSSPLTSSTAPVCPASAASRSLSMPRHVFRSSLDGCSRHARWAARSTPAPSAPAAGPLRPVSLPSVSCGGFALMSLVRQQTRIMCASTSIDRWAHSADFFRFSPPASRPPSKQPRFDRVPAGSTFRCNVPNASNNAQSPRPPPAASPEKRSRVLQLARRSLAFAGARSGLVDRQNRIPHKRVQGMAQSRPAAHSLARRRL